MEVGNSYIPSERKAGQFGFGEHVIPFTYRVQSIESKSPVLRTELSKWDENNKGVIGVCFKDKTLAWSEEAPRHTSLVAAEKKDMVARFQSIQELWSNIPVIRVDSLDLDNATNLIGFFNRSSVRPTTPLMVRLTDKFDVGDTSHEVYSGTLADFDPTKIKDK